MESRFMKTLAGYYAFPIFLVICFILVTFWLCRLFSNTAITNIPDNLNNNNNNAVPQQRNQRNLRRMTTFALAFVILHIVGGEEKLCNLKQKFSRLKTAIRQCNVNTETIHFVDDTFCKSSMSKFVDEKNLCISLTSLYLIISGFIGIFVVTWIFLKRFHRNNIQN